MRATLASFALVLLACNSQPKQQAEPEHPEPILQLGDDASTQGNPADRPRREAEVREAIAALAELERTFFANVDASALEKLERKRFALLGAASAEGCARWELLMLVESKKLPQPLTEALVVYVHHALMTSDAVALSEGMSHDGVKNTAREEAERFTCDANAIPKGPGDDLALVSLLPFDAGLPEHVSMTDREKGPKIYLFELAITRLQQLLEKQPALAAKVRQARAAANMHTLRCARRYIARNPVIEPYGITDAPPEVTSDQWPTWVASHSARTAPKPLPPVAKTTTYVSFPKGSDTNLAFCYDLTGPRPFFGAYIPNQHVEAVDTPKGKFILLSAVSEDWSSRNTTLAPFDPATFAELQLRVTMRDPKEVRVTFPDTKPEEDRIKRVKTEGFELTCAPAPTESLVSDLSATYSCP